MANVLFQTIINDAEYPLLYEFMHSKMNKIYRAHFIKRAVEEYLNKHGSEVIQGEELGSSTKPQEIIVPKTTEKVIALPEKVPTNKQSAGITVAVDNIEHGLGDDFFSTAGIK
jgi:hypothetical protein